ncbi:MAG: rod shape-determining protein MreC [Dehalococcoidia bacterium]|nr:rod shape-determining protein MreC [Dehalococcoidia bacterium]
MLMFSRYSWWVGTMIGLAFILAIMGQVGLLAPFQGVFLRVSAPFEDILSGAFEPVASFLGNVRNVNELRDENARLRLENEDLRNQVTDLQQDAARVKELEEALKITQATSGDTKVAANVVGRDSSPFVEVVSIDKGSNDGIKPGMVVLSTQGSLVGTVTTVTAKNAFVRLITDSKSKVNAQIFESQALGIVQGNPGRDLSFGLSQADAKVGNTVITSGLGGNYPPGIPIGTVSAVSGTTQDLFRKVTVEPLVRVSTVKTVLVNTTFIPQRIGVEGP